METLGDSDHQAIKLCLTVENTVYSNDILVPNFRLANFDQFKIDLSNVELIQLGRNVSADDLWNSFKRNFFQIAASCIPTEAKRSMALCRPQWFNSDVRDFISDRNRAYKNLYETAKRLKLSKLFSIAKTSKIGN